MEASLMASTPVEHGVSTPPAYQPPTLIVLGTLADLTNTGTAEGKEHGGNGKRPITMSNI
jgi:hypothetical protein